MIVADRARCYERSDIPAARARRQSRVDLTTATLWPHMETVRVDVNIPLTLHRGVTRETRDRYLREGIVSSVEMVPKPDQPQIRVFNLPLVLLSASQIIAHVNQGSRRSPLVSFTEKSHKAREYALDGGQRAEGAVLVLEVILVEEHLCNTPSGWTVGYYDHLRRIWIPTREYRSPGLDEVIRMHELARRNDATGAPGGVRERGFWDAEWLLLGEISSTEINCENVP